MRWCWPLHSFTRMYQNIIILLADSSHDHTMLTFIFVCRLSTLQRIKIIFINEKTKGIRWYPFPSVGNYLDKFQILFTLLKMHVCMYVCYDLRNMLPHTIMYLCYTMDDNVWCIRFKIYINATFSMSHFLSQWMLPTGSIFNWIYFPVSISDACRLVDHVYHVLYMSSCF